MPLRRTIMVGVWIGTAGGINIWDESSQEMSSITSNPTNGLITNYIAKFTKGTEGHSVGQRMGRRTF